jgi:hypothetical protein
MKHSLNESPLYFEDIHQTTQQHETKKLIVE